MRLSDRLNAAAAVAAAIAGAGFASGREILVFFAQYGVMGYAGAVLAAALIGGMTAGIAALAARWREGSLSGLMRRSLGRPAGSGLLMTALLLAVSAAMAAAGGELCALSFNIHGARQLGVVITVLMAQLCAARGMRLMGALGGATVAAVLAYFAALCFVQPQMELPAARPGALLSAAAYAGFNMATACGVACAAGLRITGDVRRHAASLGRITGAIMLALLAAATACLHLHWGESGSAAMPSVLIAARLGVTGYCATIAVMWAAVLTTLSGTLLSLQLQGEAYGLRAGDVRLCAAGAAVLMGCAGFEGLVDGAYPALGAVCVLYLAVLFATQWRNRSVDRGSTVATRGART